MKLSSSPVSAALFFTLAAAAVLLIAGLWGGGVWLGDEVHHYRFAKNFFWSGRPVIDAVYPTGNPPGFYYSSDPLWPFGASFLWKITGGISFVLAQIYHVFFYILLLLSTYGAARKWYGEQEAFWSLVLTATAPMIVSFGILFYLDVPGTALAVLAFWLLLERRYAGFAAVLALQFLMKRSMLFFVPVYFLILLYQNREARLKASGLAVLCLLPLLSVLFWDWEWRAHHFPQHSSMLFQLLGRLPGINQVPAVLKKEAIASFSNSSIFSLKDNAAYFGLLIISTFFTYFWHRQKKDLFLWVFILPFAVLTWALGMLPDIRYMLPLTPFLSMLASKGLRQFVKTKAAAALILFLAAAQLCAAAVYTAGQRKPQPEILEGFEYIRRTLPPKVWVLYPEFNITEYAERPVVWGNVDLGRLFKGSDDEKLAALAQADTRFLAVKKSRIYEDGEMTLKHYGGYPSSFMNSLRQSGAFALLFENEQMSIWKVKSSSPAAGQNSGA